MGSRGKGRVGHPGEAWALLADERGSTYAPRIWERRYWESEGFIQMRRQLGIWHFLGGGRLLFHKILVPVCSFRALKEAARSTKQGKASWLDQRVSENQIQQRLLLL